MEYRNLKAEESGLVRELFESYYDPGVYCVGPRYFDWLHHRHPLRADCVEADEITVLGAVEEGTLHGCLCYAPTEVFIEGQAHSAVITTESLARPESSGVFGLLARRLLGRFDFAFVMGATESLKDVYIKSFRAEYCREIARRLLILDVPMLERLLAERAEPTPTATERLEKNSALARELASGHEWVRLKTLDGLNNSYWQDVLSSGVPSCRRDPTWLEWRYLQHPHVSYEIISAEASQSSGLAVVRREQIRDFEGHALRLLEFLPTDGGAAALAGAVASYAVETGGAFLDFFCASDSTVESLPEAFLRPEAYLDLGIPYLLQPPEWRPRRSINLLSMKNRRRRDLPVLGAGQIYLTKGDGAQDIALNRGYRSAHLR